MKLLHASVVRRGSTMHDVHGRGYMRVASSFERPLGLAPGHSWWWCVLPLRQHRARHFGDIPRPGWVVGPYMVQRVALGFVRGRTVGVVELR